MPRKRRISVMQQKKYHYQRARDEQSYVQLEHNYVRSHSDAPETEGDRSPRSDCEFDGEDSSAEEMDIDNLDLNAGILVGESVEVETEEVTDPFEILRYELTENVPSPYIMDFNEKQHSIEILQLYRREHNTAVKLSLVIGKDCHVQLYVHRTLVPETHDFWSELSTHVQSASDVFKILEKLLEYGVCIGNPDPEFQELTPVGCGISSASSPEILAYREGDFCAVQGNLSYSSTIRSSQYAMLVLGARCPQCSSYRRQLKAREIRQEEKQEKTLSLSSTYKHKDMNRDMLLKKLEQQKEQIKSIQHTIDKMRRDCDKEIIRNGISMNSIQNQEVEDLMATCEEEMVAAYPDCNSFQRLFWEQQKKAIKHGTNGMRWHPTIIRWCLYLRQKSSKAYDALRDSGFITLPSSRTLFDYTHYLTSALGFQPDVVKLLREECEKREMFQEEWKSYTGILFDEIKIKEDLVYDKHSGEIKGYVKLGDIGDQLCALFREKC
ncbi:uncharacterized protein LOC134270400 [Saccostrea cucullata]|uniref:uncharacterized protein LOC134270400 n=1 Tax=Saccostrea cuccullata TaxID=36930 RepID=UPI002ED2662D